MSEFCVKCSEKEGQIELLRATHYREMECCKERIKNLKEQNERLLSQNEALILDLAFYDPFYDQNILIPKES